MPIAFSRAVFSANLNLTCSGYAIGDDNRRPARNRSHSAQNRENNADSQEANCRKYIRAWNHKLSLVGGSLNRCPLCRDGDQIPQRSEMTRCAKAEVSLLTIICA